MPSIYSHLYRFLVTDILASTDSKMYLSLNHKYAHFTSIEKGDIECKPSGTFLNCPVYKNSMMDLLDSDEIICTYKNKSRGDYVGEDWTKSLVFSVGIPLAYNPQTKSFYSRAEMKVLQPDNIIRLKIENMRKYPKS